MFGLHNHLLIPVWELVSCRHGAGTKHPVVSENGNKAWGVLVLSFDIRIVGINGLLQPVVRSWPEIFALFVSFKNCFWWSIKKEYCFYVISCLVTLLCMQTKCIILATSLSLARGCCSQHFEIGLDLSNVVDVPGVCVVAEFSWETNPKGV